MAESKTSAVGRAARDAAKKRQATAKTKGGKKRFINVHIIEYRVEVDLDNDDNGRSLNETLDFLREYGSAEVIDSETIEGEI